MSAFKKSYPCKLNVVKGSYGPYMLAHAPQIVINMLK